jgi:lipoprotein-releasing system ATP-binding protein
MSDPVLDLQGIQKSYKTGAVQVLKGIDLTVKTGEIVALVAPSGAGKSTLLHIAGLLDTADAGTVSLAGNDMTRMSDAKRTMARRSGVGFVYQFHHLLPEFSATENIVLPQLAAGVPDRIAQDRASHRPSTLSGGEQQRVAFCRALANQPNLLLADEPTGNLDPTTSDTVFDVLMDLVRNTGLSAVIATHNLELARRMDRMLRLEDGKLTEVS